MKCSIGDTACCVYRTFRIMDDDGSKTLNLEEFQKGLETYGLCVGKEKGKEIFTLVDKDRSGTIDFDEFLEKLRVSDQVQGRH